MKTTIELDMSPNSEDRYINEKKMRDILNIDEMKIAIWDMDHSLRAEMKYNEELTEESYNALEKMRDLFQKNLRERNLYYILEE